MSVHRSILDQIAAWAHISVSAAGQLITVFAIANAIGSLIFVMAMTKMDRRKFLMLSLAIVVLGSILTVTLQGFGFLIVSRVVLAIGGGVFVIGAKTVASKLAAPGKQAGAIGTVIIGFSASLIAGVPIGRVVAAAYGWKVIFVGIGPGLQFNLVALAPEASGFMLSLYGSILQLSIAADGGIGGIAAGSASMRAVGWIAAAAVALAVILAAVSFSSKTSRRLSYVSN